MTSLLIAIKTTNAGFPEPWHLCLNVRLDWGAYNRFAPASVSTVEIACRPGDVIQSTGSWQPFDEWLALDLNNGGNFCRDCSRDVIRSIRDIHITLKED